MGVERFGGAFVPSLELGTQTDVVAVAPAVLAGVGMRRGRPKGERLSSVITVPGNISRISRLLALAIRFEDLVARGEVVDYAELARLGHVTRARLTQIMNLTLLAPDIQEQILFLPRTTRGHDPIAERDMRPIAAEVHWGRQRRMWARIAGGAVSV